MYKQTLNQILYALVHILVCRCTSPTFLHSFGFDTSSEVSTTAKQAIVENIGMPFGVILLSWLPARRTANQLLGFRAPPSTQVIQFLCTSPVPIILEPKYTVMIANIVIIIIVLLLVWTFGRLSSQHDDSCDVTFSMTLIMSVFDGKLYQFVSALAT